MHIFVAIRFFDSPLKYHAVSAPIVHHKRTLICKLIFFPIKKIYTKNNIPIYNRISSYRSDLPNYDSSRVQQLFGGVTKKLEVTPRKPNPTKTTPATQQSLVATTDFLPPIIDSNVVHSSETITISSSSSSEHGSNNKKSGRPLSVADHSILQRRIRGDSIASSSATSSTVTVRALSECFTHHHHHHQYKQIKIGQSSPKLCSAEKSSSIEQSHSSQTSPLNESNQLSERNANNSVQPTSSTASHTPLERNNYRTESNNLTVELNSKVSDSSNVDKSFSCRLYDCMPIGACTARNESCEPGAESTKSSGKLDSRKNSIISRTAQLSKRRFLQSVMDRSMDSIGSCSLDVDAVSTDFSGIYH